MTRAWEIFGSAMTWLLRGVLTLGLVITAGWFAYEALYSPQNMGRPTLGDMSMAVVRLGLVLLPVGSSINVWYKEAKSLPLTWWDKKQPAASILIAVGFLIRFAILRFGCV